MGNTQVRGVRVDLGKGRRGSDEVQSWPFASELGMPAARVVCASLPSLID